MVASHPPQLSQSPESNSKSSSPNLFTCTSIAIPAAPADFDSAQQERLGAISQPDLHRVYAIGHRCHIYHICHYLCPKNMMAASIHPSNLPYHRSRPLPRCSTTTCRIFTAAVKNHEITIGDTPSTVRDGKCLLPAPSIKHSPFNNITCIIFDEQYITHHTSYLEFFMASPANK